MQKSRIPEQFLFCAMSVIPVAYVAFMWNKLPEVMPIHYNIHNEVDGTGNKSTLMISTMLMAGVSIFTYLLVANIHKIDPKRAAAGPSATFDKLARGVMIFLTALNILIVSDATHGGHTFAEKSVIPLIGLLLMFLGNYMHNVKPNYFVGIRIPWTLNDENNWKQTHRLAGRLWFAGGLLIAIISLVLPMVTAIILMQVILAIIVFVPIGYSFRLFKKGTQHLQ